jgi:chromosome segregation protein
MHLSSLTLVGFKSFPQKTQISFEPGITAVVGPNGCGKSNLCDAIRWVLGEQGYRSLRAERMEDIIFNGNGSHLPLGMAEVSLTISAHQNELPTLFGEITVTRRLFRSGESEYLLNGSPCLLRDILNLFLDSGLGNIPYALIEQGSLSSIIDCKPGERRAMIDEAAGIMKYRVRRRAANAKLEAAEQNLLRLEDIIREVRQQRDSLHRQAKKAKEYEEVRQKIEYLDGYLKWIQYREAQAETRRLAHRLEKKQEEALSLTIQIDQGNSQLEKERLHLLKLDSSLEETRASQYRLQAEVEKTSVQLEMMRQESRDATAAGEKLQAEIETGRSEIDQLQSGYAREKREGGTIERRLESILQRRKELQEKERSISQQLAQLTEALEEKRRDAIQAAAACSNLRNQRVSLENQKQRLAQQKDRLLAQLETTSSEKADLHDQEKRLLARLRDLVFRYGEWESKRAGVASAMASAKQEEGETDLDLSRLQRQVDESSSRLASLEDLQRSHEGYGEGARFLLEAQDPQDPECHGLPLPLIDLLQVTSGFEKAIESLLDSELQGLVVEDLEEIRSHLRRLKAAGKGGATFLPLSLSCHSGSSEMEEEISRTASSLPGILRRAIDLIRCEPRYEGLMKRLFWDRWVAEDLETALRNFQEHQRPSATATLMGEVVTSRGTVRLPATSSGLLVRRKEIEDLTQRLRGAEEELQRAQCRKEALGKELRGLEDESSALEKEGHSLQIEQVASEKDRDQLRIDLDKLGRREEYLGIEIRTAEEEIAQLEADSLANTEEERTCDGLRQAAEGGIREFQAALETLRTEHQEIVAEMVANQRELDSEEEKRGQSQMQIARLEEQIRAQTRRITEMERECLQIQQRRLRTQEMLQEKESPLSDLRRQEAGVEASLKETANRREEQLARVGKAEEELRQLKRQVSEMDETIHDLKIQKAQIDQSLHHLLQALSSETPADSLSMEDRYLEESMETSVAQEELLKDKEKCRRLEPVNMAALRDYEDLSKRYAFLGSQSEDLCRSVASLRQTIAEINKTTQRLFREAFQSINRNFQEHCTKLFGGGTAEIRLRGSEDGGEEELGVDIMVSPPGKHLAHLDLFSGGEKAMAGLSFLMALFQYRPAPFCFLDEVDAPLDDANLGRFLSLLKGFSQRHQFILVTHNKKSMEAANSLYGVTMEEPGISKLVSVKFNGSASSTGLGEGNGH